MVFSDLYMYRIPYNYKKKFGGLAVLGKDCHIKICQMF